MCDIALKIKSLTFGLSSTWARQGSSWGQCPLHPLHSCKLSCSCHLCSHATVVRSVIRRRRGEWGEAFKWPPIPQTLQAWTAVLLSALQRRHKLLPVSSSHRLVMSMAADCAHPAARPPLLAVQHGQLWTCRLCYQGRTHVPWSHVCVIGRSFLPDARQSTKAQSFQIFIWFKNFCCCCTKKKKSYQRHVPKNTEKTSPTPACWLVKHLQSIVVEVYGAIKASLYKTMSRINNEFFFLQDNKSLCCQFFLPGL